jgi:DNA-binding NtrC family response regulator
LLVAHFLNECGYVGNMGSLIPPARLEELQSHRWPGNVRELRNWVEATVAMGESPELTSEVGPSGPPPAPGQLADSTELLGLPYKDARQRVLESFERRYLKHLLEASGGNVAQAARTAQMDRTYLIKLIQRHALRSR